MKSKSMLVITLVLGLAYLGMTTTPAMGQGVSPPKLSPKQKMQKAFEAQLMMLDRMAAESKDRVQRISNERDELNEKLFELNVTEASYPEVMRLLQTQRVQLIIDLAGLDARQKLMVEMQQTQQQPQESDEVIELLQKVVDEMTEMQKLLEERFKTGISQAAEVQSGKVTLLQAKLRLAEATAKRPKSEPNDALSQVSIERIEKQAKLATVESLLKKFYQARSNIDSVKELDAAYEAEARRLIDFQERIQESRLEFEFQMNENF